MKTLALVFALCATGAVAQGIEVAPLDPILQPGDPGYRSSDLGDDGFVEATPEPKALTGQGALLRGLDKVSGEVIELELANGGEGRLGRLIVSLSECRYPEENPDGDAFAWLEVVDTARGSILFQGWMVASSPALNPFDHPRYDVWVLRCMTA